MRINLMDPALQNVAGHHLDLDLKVARVLSGQGHSVRVYAQEAASQDVLSAFGSIADITPLFRVRPYADTRRLDPYAGELIGYNQQSHLLAADIRSTAEADVWLWPTIMASEVNACAGISGDALVAGCVQMPVNIGEQQNGAMWWRHALLAAKRSNTRLRIGAMEPDQRYDYLPLTADGVFELFPHFYEGAPIAAPKKALKTIGFFGQQRAVKGVSMILPLATKLMAQGYQVVIHDSQQQLTGIGQTGATVIGFVDDLAPEIAKCDLVVLPYSQEKYRKRGSGILLDALASGIPAVVPFDTIPGRWVDRTGAGTQFAVDSEEWILAAVEEARLKFPQIAQAAFETSLRWKDRYGPRQFVAGMLGDAGI